MGSFQVCSVMLLFISIICVIGYIGWGFSDEKLKAERKRSLAKSRLIEALKKENLELKRQISFANFEKGGLHDD